MYHEKRLYKMFKSRSRIFVITEKVKKQYITSLWSCDGFLKGSKLVPAASIQPNAHRLLVEYPTSWTIYYLIHVTPISKKNKVWVFYYINNVPSKMNSCIII